MSVMPDTRAPVAHDLTDEHLLDPDAWEVPDHLTEADCLFETGHHGLRSDAGRSEEDDR